MELHCRVEEQKETIDGLKDEVCGKIAEAGHAGLCKQVHTSSLNAMWFNRNGQSKCVL